MKKHNKTAIAVLLTAAMFVSGFSGRAATIQGVAKTEISKMAEASEEGSVLASEDAFSQHKFDILNENSQIISTIEDAKVKT